MQFRFLFVKNVLELLLFARNFILGFLEISEPVLVICLEDSVDDPLVELETLEVHVVVVCQEARPLVVAEQLARDL